MIYDYTLYTLMNKIYTLMNKSNVDWKGDVLYPITLFSVACLILLLSSFSTKASYENESAIAKNTITAHKDFKDSLDKNCCQRIVSQSQGCDGDQDYVISLESDQKDINGIFISDTYSISSATEISWVESEKQIHFLASNLKANSDSGEFLNVDITYSGLVDNPPVGSPIANKCFDPNTGAWKYYTEIKGEIISSKYGSQLLSEQGAALQIGVGANTQAAPSFGYGASGVLSFQKGNSHWVKGNTNVHLSQTCSIISDNDITLVGINKTGLYKINQHPLDGSIKYSNRVLIDILKSQGYEPLVKVVLNSPDKLINVEIEKNESDVVTVKLFDLKGKAVPMDNVNVAANGASATLQIPIENLPIAAYILRINVGDQVFAKKITLV